MNGLVYISVKKFIFSMKSAVLISFLCLSIAVAGELDLTDELIEWVNTKYGSQAKLRVENWRDLLNVKIEAESDKLKQVNDFFNQIPYRSDFENWDKKDYWATPVESLGMNAADCEDYAIAKYFTLRELGVAPEKLRITYVKAIEINQAHMVLAYYEEPASIPLILDNLKPEIRSADKRKDLVPVYGFNAEGLWLAVNRGHGKHLGDSKRISLWNKVIKKMKQELKQ